MIKMQRKGSRPKYPKERKPTKVLVTIRLEEQQYDFVATYSLPDAEVEQYDFQNRIRAVLSDYRSMHALTCAELARIFDAKESCVLIDVAQCFKPDAAHPKAALELFLRDGEFYDNICSKWGADMETMVAKVQKLTEFQAYMAFHVGLEYWNLSDETRGEHDIEALASHLFEVGGLRV
jgi:hypothetical protein